MAKNKTEEKETYISPCVKDINDTWCCSAVFVRKNGKPYKITCCGIGAKAPQAKKDAKARLERRCQEYLQEEPGAYRLTWEEYEGGNY